MLWCIPGQLVSLGQVKLTTNCCDAIHCLYTLPPSYDMNLYSDMLSGLTVWSYKYKAGLCRETARATSYVRLIYPALSGCDSVDTWYQLASCPNTW